MMIKMCDKMPILSLTDGFWAPNISITHALYHYKKRIAHNAHMSSSEGRKAQVVCIPVRQSAKTAENSTATAVIKRRHPLSPTKRLARGPSMS